MSSPWGTDVTWSVSPPSGGTITSSGLSHGDSVAAVGLGAGGATLVASSGQSILFGSAVTPVIGVTWMPRESIREWRSVASSSDGTKVVALEMGGYVYTSTANPASTIVVPQGSSATLLYSGSDTFIVGSGFGTLYAW